MPACLRVGGLAASPPLPGCTAQALLEVVLLLETTLLSVGLTRSPSSSSGLGVSSAWAGAGWLKVDCMLLMKFVFVGSLFFTTNGLSAEVRRLSCRRARTFPEERANTAVRPPSLWCPFPVAKDHRIHADSVCVCVWGEGALTGEPFGSVLRASPHAMVDEAFSSSWPPLGLGASGGVSLRRLLYFVGLLRAP